MIAFLRNSWRQLTSMRTALVLLFLLAVAAIPGSVLPQRSVNIEKVAAYYRAHPQLAPQLDRLSGFDVYSSPWFAAIYLLLFTSLVGCVVPRLIEHARALRSRPPKAPRRLERLPQHETYETGADDPAAGIAAVLRRHRFRTVVRTEEDGATTVAGEKGYLKETGNLLFHFALLAVLVGVGFGHWYGWSGNRLLVQGPDTGFCNSVTQYDDSSFGPRVQGGDLPVFCLDLTGFQATYQPNGIPKTFLATVDVTEGDGPVERGRTFTVNDPLRLRHANVHLLGQGYAPILRFTDRYGRQQTKVVPFLPVDSNLTSEGVAQFPDVNIGPSGKRDPTLQVAFEGVYVPTAGTAASPASTFPEQRSPLLFLTAYRGDLGVEVGNPGSIYTLDRRQLASGALKRVSAEQPFRLAPGRAFTLDDGTKLEFLGTRPFVTLSIRYDPTQTLVLAGAVLGLLGLMLSLAGHRRRVWFRVSARSGPAGEGSGSLVEAGGLPRTDYSGFADEFQRLVDASSKHEGAT